jgi:hypothetical protein
VRGCGTPLALDSLRLVLQVEDVARPFAQALHALATGYRQLSEPLQPRQRTAWRGAMSQMVRKYYDVVIPAYSSIQVSEGALKEAHRRKVDLFRADWSQQPRFDPGRSVFHLEHVVTVATVVQRCLTGTESDALETLTGDALRVAWILKDENRRLDALGVRTVRPDPGESYRAAGIVLLNESTHS